MLYKYFPALKKYILYVLSVDTESRKKTNLIGSVPGRLEYLKESVQFNGFPS